MAHVRREKTWTVSGTSLGNVREAILGVLRGRGARITRDDGDTIEGQGGSFGASLFVFTDRTAPYRVHVRFWQTGGEAVVIEAAFEEAAQMGKAGPAKVQKYTKLADRSMDELSTALGRLGSLDVGAPQPGSPATDIPDQIKKLAELRDGGALTSEEFEAKKTELLGRM